MSAKDAHYGGNLVDGAHMVHLFGDVATELLIMHDGDEGLFVAYDNVEFLAPVYAGDYIEAVGEIVKVGNTSRKMVFEARKVVAARPDISPSAADVLKEPVVVCRASGTCVVKKEDQRIPESRKRNFRPVPDTKASRDAKTAGRSAGERKRPMRPEILGEQVRTGLAATSDKATEFNHFQTFQPKTPWKN